MDDKKTISIKPNDSKLEKVLKLSSDELIAKAISDILKKDEKSNDNFKK